jgi:hypothetical protein
MNTDPIETSENVIDTRDVIARHVELEKTRADLVAAKVKADEARWQVHDQVADEDEAHDAYVEALEALENFDEEYGEELDNLRDLISDLHETISLSSIEDGEALINYDYWEDYAREQARDIFGINETEQWPYNHINWEAAALELENDYATVEFGDSSFFVRNV